MSKEELLHVVNAAGEHKGAWRNGVFYAAPIEAGISGMEAAAKRRRGDRILNGVGIGLIVIIVAGTSIAVGHAITQEREAANAPKAEIVLPPGYRYIDMPEGQADVITFCDQGNRIYKDTSWASGEAIAVIPNDPSCS